MTIREFFIGRTVVFTILVVLALGVFGYKKYVSTTIPEDISHVTQNENGEPQSFIWKYENASSLNPDGQPNTAIFLEMVYPNGNIERTYIDTVSSSCNELPDALEERVLNSSVAQCYGAGLGYRFKVTKGAASYLIERKRFEEGSPEYNPPVYQYEVITSIPFNKPSEK